MRIAETYSGEQLIFDARTVVLFTVPIHFVRLLDSKNVFLKVIKDVEMVYDMSIYMSQIF